MLQETKVILTSSPSRDDIYAELRFRGSHWGEVRLAPDGSQLEVVIYPPTCNDSYVFPASELHSLISKAIARMEQFYEDQLGPSD